MNHSTKLLLLSAVLSASAAACGKPTDEEYDDVASATAALVSEEPAGESEAASDAIMAGRGGLPPALTRSGAGHLAGRRGTLDYSFDVTCADAMGATVASCEGADQAHLVLAWTGELATQRRNATLERHGDWSVTGLTTPTATMNGTGSFHMEGDFQAITRTLSRSYVYDYQASYQGVTVSTDTRRITGGHATYEISAQRTTSRANRTVERDLSISADVTFLGDGRATIVLDGDRHYTATLADGTVVTGP